MPRAHTVLTYHALRTCLYAVFLSFMLALSVQPAHAENEEVKRPRKNILFLNSYHNGYSWSDNILKGIKDTLNNSEYSIVLQVEYMDAKKFHYEDTVQTLLALYRDKFRDKTFDLIIVSDNIAYNFILAYGEELFPNVPIVICGVNDYDQVAIENRNFTGVIESFDVASNINLALELHPSMRRMVVIGDKSVTGQAIRNQIVRALPQFEGRLEFEFWSNYKLNQMLKWVRSVRGDTFFYFIPMYRDIDGEFYSAQELLQQVRANTNAPLYSNWKFLLGHGIVGGKLLSGVEHGAAAARQAIKVLGGTPAKDIPIIKDNDEPWNFDYNELKHLHVSERRLPQGSSIINAPSRFYELNKQVFWTIIVSLVILTIIMVLLVMNILEKRSVEQRIKDQLSFLRLLMDTIPIPIYSKDKYGRYQECNLAFEQFFDVNREEILNRNEWQLQGKGLSHLHDSEDNKLLRDPGVSSYEHTIPNLRGRTHNIILHKATNRNARGDVAGLVGVVFDYTDRKQAEDSLRAAEEKYRSIFENSPLGIFRIKPDGGFADVNPALAKMGGFQSPEALHTYDPDYPRRLVEKVNLTGNLGEEVIQFDREFTAYDGSKIIANISVRVIRDALGNVSLLEGFAENITERKKAEKALRESERMLQSVLDNIPQLVSWKDTSLRYLGANRSFESFFGVSDTSALMNRTNTDVMPSTNDAKNLQVAEASVIASNVPEYNIKQTITGPHGDVLWLEINRIPLHNDNSEVVGLLTTAEDITQRINLERQLLQSQKMEAIGTLAGGISHDFNNILTSIINSVELALTDIEHGSLTYTDLDRALKAAQRGSGLVKQILTFSRPSMEGYTTTNLNEVLAEALGLIKASLPRNIEIKENLSETTATTHADPTQIHQVVMNLCTNSFQALRGSGGMLEVRLDLVRLEYEDAQMLNLQEGNYYLITVADNGPGIPQEITDKIFDPFFTTKGKTEGTGLGLAVVHGIIKGHRGSIRVVSKPFERTAFEIYLPSLELPPLEQQPKSITVERGEGRILFVEDDEDQLVTIPRVLESLGYTVDAVNDPKQAAAMVIESPQKWDLVITDFDMPNTNGIELAKQLHKIIPTLPVILVSGRDVASQGASSVPNILSVLTKPYNRNMIAEAIRDVL